MPVAAAWAPSARPAPQPPACPAARRSAATFFSAAASCAWASVASACAFASSARPSRPASPARSCTRQRDDCSDHNRGKGCTHGAASRPPISHRDRRLHQRRALGHLWRLPQRRGCARCRRPASTGPPSPPGARDRRRRPPAPPRVPPRFRSPARSSPSRHRARCRVMISSTEHSSGARPGGNGTHHDVSLGDGADHAPVGFAHRQEAQLSIAHPLGGVLHALPRPDVFRACLRTECGDHDPSNMSPGRGASHQVNCPFTDSGLERGGDDSLFEARTRGWTRQSSRQARSGLPPDSAEDAPCRRCPVPAPAWSGARRSPPSRASRPRCWRSAGRGARSSGWCSRPATGRRWPGARPGRLFPAPTAPTVATAFSISSAAPSPALVVLAGARARAGDVQRQQPFLGIDHVRLRPAGRGRRAGPVDHLVRTHVPATAAPGSAARPATPAAARPCVRTPPPPSDRASAC